MNECYDSTTYRNKDFLKYLLLLGVGVIYIDLIFVYCLLCNILILGNSNTAYIIFSLGNFL